LSHLGLLWFGVYLNHVGFRRGSGGVQNALDDLFSEEGVKRLVGVGRHGATDAHLMEWAGLGGNSGGWGGRRLAAGEGGHQRKNYLEDGLKNGGIDSDFIFGSSVFVPKGSGRQNGLRGHHVHGWFLCFRG
jgi:hypothetical protein